MRKPKPSGNDGRTHQRKSSSYDRRPGRIPPGRRILIVCEGAKTEPDYFLNLRKQLKLSLVEVEIEKNAGAPIAIVDKAFCRGGFYQCCQSIPYLVNPPKASIYKENFSLA